MRLVVTTTTRLLARFNLLLDLPFSSRQGLKHSRDTTRTEFGAVLFCWILGGLHGLGPEGVEDVQDEAS